MDRLERLKQERMRERAAAAAAGRRRLAVRVALYAITAALACSALFLGSKLWGYHVSDMVYAKAFEVAAIPSIDELREAQLAWEAGRKEGVSPEEQARLESEYQAKLFTVWPVTDSEPDPYAEELSGKNLSALKSENPDVIGWIDIPGTKVSYPFVASSDNQEYLKIAWDGSKASAGSIFMDMNCNAGLTGFNTILYGHNMMNGSMFGTLSRFRDHDFWEENPYVYLVTDGGVFRYRIYSVRMAGIGTSAFLTGTFSQEDQESFLSDGISGSEIFTGVEPATGSRILTLSTCTGLVNRYDIRFVVQAVLEWHQDY